MITRFEFGQINDWPNKVPYPGNDYCEKTLKKLSDCFKLYQSKYLNRKYTIQFSNNEEVDLEMETKNLAHILGVDHKNLMKDIFRTYRERVLDVDPSETIGSYALLQAIINRGSQILDYDRMNKACMGLNYYRIGIKCDIFSKLADLSNFDYGCINFNKDTYNIENPEKNFTPQSTKLLYIPSDEVIIPYFMMGIRIDENNPDLKYIVETLIACDDPRRFFAGQEVVIPTQILTNYNGILDKKNASAGEKIKLLRDYRSIVAEYNIPDGMNIYGDYFSMLMQQRDEGPKKVLR